VNPFAVAPVGVERFRNIWLRKRHGLDTEFVQKHHEFGGSFITTLGTDNNTSFVSGNGAGKPPGSIADNIQKMIGLGFFFQNGNESRGLDDDHPGLPQA
jgi:hypothetical protein